MSRFGIRKISSVALLSVGFTFFGFSQATSLQAATVEECSKELLLSFFPEAFVTEVLQKYQVSKEKWEPIVKGLKEKNDEVIKLVDEQASKMNPNPLKDPSQKQQAVKIFRESLYQVFASVLKANGVSDDQKIQSMLGEIQQLKTKRFAQCMETNKPAEPMGKVAIAETPVKKEAVSHDKDPSKKVEKDNKNESDEDDDFGDDDEDEDENDDKNKDSESHEKEKHSEEGGVRRGAIASSDLDDELDDNEEQF